MTCILCNREHDREGEEMCLLCAAYLAESESDIADTTNGGIEHTLEVAKREFGDMMRRLAEGQE